MLNRRVTLIRKNPYNSPGNKRRVVKGKNGTLRVQYLHKKPSPTRCGVCRVVLQGLKVIDYKGKSRAKKNDLTVNRAYGGTNCGKCVRDRIVRAFLNEEETIVKKFLKSKAETA